MEKEQAERFADAVRRARHARGLSIRRAANTGSISDTTWRRLESAEALLRYDPRPDTLRAVATSLRVKADQVHHWAAKSFEGIDAPKPLEEALAEGDERDQVPSALASAWSRLTDDQRERVIGFAQALAGEPGPGSATPG